MSFDEDEEEEEEERLTVMSAIKRLRYTMSIDC